MRACVYEVCEKNILIIFSTLNNLLCSGKFPRMLKVLHGTLMPIKPLFLSVVAWPKESTIFWSIDMAELCPSLQEIFSSSFIVRQNQSNCFEKFENKRLSKHQNVLTHSQRCRWGAVTSSSPHGSPDCRCRHPNEDILLFPGQTAVPGSHGARIPPSCRELRIKHL